jgi:hypothetical protein
MFTKNERTKIFFDLVTHIKNNYQYYADTYRFDSKQFRNDIAFSIAKHILNGFEQNNTENLPPVLTLLDKDVLYSVDKKLTLLVSPKLDSNFCAAAIDGIDIHVMNKQSIIRNKDALIGINMSFGYLLIVSEHDSVDYLNLAYALAISIKNTQKPGYDQVALVIDNKEKINQLKSSWVFDHVIEWDQETFWDGRSWMDQLSPFDATVCLDVDMLFMRDYSHWIDYFLENCELYVANKSYTYRGELSRRSLLSKSIYKK